MSKQNDDDSRTIWRKIELTVMVLGLLSMAWIGLSINGSTHRLPFIDNPAIEATTATTTAEFSLEGIEDRAEMKERIQVMIDKERARQKKQEAEQKLNELQSKQTSLE